MFLIWNQLVPTPPASILQEVLYSLHIIRGFFAYDSIKLLGFFGQGILGSNPANPIEVRREFLCNFKQCLALIRPE
jgi:K+-transporting ATPase A subunit